MKSRHAQVSIVVRGARVHNLRDVSLEIPKRRLVVFTGVSGSGKSSLAFDTLFAEGQRRYIDSLSVYARMFMPSAGRPDVDEIVGLSPTVSIEQKTISHNPRSTVGTITEIYDHLRVLFANLGRQHCHHCGDPVGGSTPARIASALGALPEGTRFLILAPLVRNRKGEFRDVFERMRKLGFSRVRVDGRLLRLEDVDRLAKQHKHDVDVVVDRHVARGTITDRLRESVHTALEHGEGRLVLTLDGDAAGLETLYSASNYCARCDLSFPPLSHQSFSFNSPLGWCPGCAGTGTQISSRGETLVDEDGVAHVCTTCGGDRVRRESGAVRVAGHTLPQLVQLDVATLRAVLSSVQLEGTDQLVGGELLVETISRLRFLDEVGLGYISLHRSGPTLSGGEAQRVRLARQLGSELTGVLYVLDEPSIGLHQRDNARLLATLERLRDAGNTVVVVEHDEETIRAADWVVDFGPGAGTHGGNVVFSGPGAALADAPDSATGDYVSGRRAVPIPATRRPGSGASIVIVEPRANNLRGESVRVPLGTLVCVTGVSGAGKSTLVNEILFPAVTNHVSGSRHPVGPHARIDGLEHIDKVIEIDQAPIGRTPRSNPATYTKVFDEIRAVLATLPDAKIYGYAPGRFSFNVEGGRCEACCGAGVTRIEMGFYEDVFVTCEACRGRRFNDATLRVRFKGRSVSEILGLSFDAALEMFQSFPKVRRSLQTVVDVGLGYLTLGQPSPTLSGGEAQRMKLSRELSRAATGKTLYVLDEPTTGLHFQDVARLLGVLHRLVDSGNTVVVVEHNLDFIAAADHVIDLGPDGGTKGGSIVAAGTPEHVSSVAESHTGACLGRVLRSRRVP